MSDLLELARTYAGMATDADNNMAAVPVADLDAVRSGLLVASTATIEVLVNMCGGDQERARVELSRALDLPHSVLKRRSRQAAEVIAHDKVPSRSLTAAHAALMILAAQDITAHVERRHATIQ